MASTSKIRADDVCRLCLAKDNLVWVFEKRLASSMTMNDVVFVTTGVEINLKDKISQKICEKCYQISQKMYQFRQQSLKNDNYLKEQYKELASQVNLKDKVKPRICRERASEKTPVKDELKKIPAKEEPSKVYSQKPPTEDESRKTPAKEVPSKEVSAVKTAYKIHPSITRLFKVHPQIKLPTICLKKDIEPFVSMEMDAVENYFKKKSLNFQKCTHLALRWEKKVATKKTSAKTPTQTTPKTAVVENKSDNSIKNNTKAVEISGPLQFPAERASSAEKIHPINIKRKQGRDKLRYKIVNSQVADKSDKDSAKSSDDNKPSTSKKRSGKRKLSDSDLASEPEAKKSIIEAVGLAPKKVETQPGSMFVEKSVKLFICSTCNSVQYNEKGLKKHQEKHLKCQFCKTKFKTMDLKAEHIQFNCIVKNMMNHLPSIPLEKIDRNVTIREAHQAAFVGFPRITGVKLDKEADVIEILSDDEDNTQETGNEASKNGVTVENNSVTSTTDPLPAKEPTASSGSASHSNTDPTIQETSISSSVVKPDILIKSNNLLDTIDPKIGDIKVVKELLVNYRQIKIDVDRGTQTELPTTASIFVNRDNLTTELRFLKQLLLVYKVPVEIRRGTFNVEYSYESKETPPKKLDLWNDLTPVDVKSPNRSGIPQVLLPTAPNLRFVSGNRNPTSYTTQNNVLNSQTKFVSVLGNSSPAPQVYSVSDNGTITSPSIPLFVQDLPLTNPFTISTSFPLNNSTLNTPAAGNSFHLANNAVVATPDNTKTVTTATETVSAPMAGTIRVKNVWELK